MKRKIITIDRELCNGCGLCVEACHERAIGLVEGKATLLRDDYCDGLGDCLPSCPTNAITFEEREALPYNEEEVKRNMERNKGITNHQTSSSNNLYKKNYPNPPVSRLNQWPVQIKLVPMQVPYFNQADLLIAADCTAYSYGNFHEHFMKNRVTLIGCPKLDNFDYGAKLTEILSLNDIKSITVVRMTVPCCGNLVNYVKSALKNSGRIIPWQVITLSPDGSLVE